jgi:hypothetical protein
MPRGAHGPDAARIVDLNASSAGLAAGCPAGRLPFDANRSGPSMLIKPEATAMWARTRFQAAVLLAAIVALAGCGGATPGGGQPTAGPGNAGSGQATQAPGATSQGMGTPGPGGAGNGQGPAYQAGAATASVTVAGSSYELSGGTCEQDAAVFPVFELVIGKLEDAQHLNVFVSDMSNPIHDGDYSGGVTLVTVGVDGDNHAVPAKVTLAGGQTSGSFSGTSAGNNPVAVSGSFRC